MENVDGQCPAAMEKVISGGDGQAQHTEFFSLHTNFGMIMMIWTYAEDTDQCYLFFKWLPEVKHYSPRTPIVLVGTKLDLRKDKPSFVLKTDDPSIVAHVECSALTGVGIGIFRLGQNEH